MSQMAAATAPRSSRPALVFVNASTLMDDASFTRAVNANLSQLRSDVCPAWAMSVPSVIAVQSWQARNFRLPWGSLLISVVDQPTDPGAFGWHTEDIGPNGRIRQYGEVACQPVLDNGGDLIAKALSVATVMSHEGIEALLDPTVVRFAFDGGRFTAWEGCDPCENDSYAVNGVTVSNFVYPAWFDPQNTVGPFDHMGKITAPLSADPGGYMVVVAGGQVQQVYGDDTQYPAWRKATKDRPWSRTHRRMVGG